MKKCSLLKGYVLLVSTWFRAQVFLGLPSMQSGVARHQQLQRNCLGTNVWLSIGVIVCWWWFLTVAVDVQLSKRCVVLEGFAQIFHAVFANGVIFSSERMVIDVIPWIWSSCFHQHKPLKSRQVRVLFFWRAWLNASTPRSPIPQSVKFHSCPWLSLDPHHFDDKICLTAQTNVLDCGVPLQKFTKRLSSHVSDCVICEVSFVLALFLVHDSIH